MIYLDSAAVVKLVQRVRNGGVAGGGLQRADIGGNSSVLMEVESFRALARYTPQVVTRLPAVLDQIELIDLTPRIRALAQTIEPMTVRSLDAIHLATALHQRSALTTFVTYDKRLLGAARTADLPVSAPE